METSVFSSKDAEEEHVMHSKSNNIKFTSSNHTNEVVDELFESLRSKYQGNLERSQFIFDLVQLMHYKCHQVNFRRGGSFIDSPDCIKNAIIYLKNKDDKYFQYALNYEEIKLDPERVSNIKPFINKYM